MNDVTFIIRNLENQESVREKSGKSQGIVFVKVCGNPAILKPYSLSLCIPVATTQGCNGVERPHRDPILKKYGWLQSLPVITRKASSNRAT